MVLGLAEHLGMDGPALGTHCPILKAWSVLEFNRVTMNLDVVGVASCNHSTPSVNSSGRSITVPVDAYRHTANDDAITPDATCPVGINAKGDTALGPNRWVVYSRCVDHLPFVCRRAHPSSGGVPTPLVKEHFEVVKQGGPASPWPSNHSPISPMTVEQRASITAVSSQLPRRLMQQVMPCIAKTSR